MKRKFSKVLVILIVVLMLVPLVGATEYPGQFGGPFFVGSRIYSGAGGPGAGFGLEGDYYLDTSSANLYNMTAGVWVLRMNLLGSSAATVLALDEHIASNVTVIYDSVHTNESALLRVADDHISTNVSTAANLLAADQHIQQNLSTVNIWVQENKSAIYLEVEDQFHANDSATLRLADDHILSNVSSASTAGAVLIADQHILSNQTTVFTNVHVNESALLLETETQFHANDSAVTKWASDAITANLSSVTLGAINQLVNPLIASNKTDTLSGTWTNLSLLINGSYQAAAIKTSLDNTWFNLSFLINGSRTTADMLGTQTNLSLLINNSYSAAALRTADDHISTNLSSSVTYGGVNQQVNPLIASNKTDAFSGTWTNLSLLINGSYSAAALRTADDHISTNLSSSVTYGGVNQQVNPLIASNTTAIFTAEQTNRSADRLTEDNNIASNKTNILAGTWQNLSLLINGTYKAEAVRLADDHISTNLSSSVSYGGVNQQVNPLIASNKTDALSGTWYNLSLLINQTAVTSAMTGTQANLSLLINNSYSAAALRSADDHISTNASAASNLLAADQHIASNVTMVLTAEQTNRSADRLTEDNNIASNKTNILSAVWTNQSLLINGTYKAEAVRLADDHISTNLSSSVTYGGVNQQVNPLIASNLTMALSATWANFTIWDQHIASNKSDIFTGVHQNESAMVLADINMDSINRSMVQGEIASNKTDAFSGTWANFTVWDQHIASNKTATLAAVWTNQSLLINGTYKAEAVRLADDHISTNLSSSVTYGGVNQQVNPLIASNKTDAFSGTWTNLSLLINGSYQAAAVLISDQHETSNTTAIFTAQSLNRTLWGNFSVMAQSMVPDNTNGATVLAPNSTDFTAGPMTAISLEFPFSANTQTNATFAYVMPSQWTGGALTFSAIWYSIGGSGSVNWNLTAYCAKDGDALNARWSMAPATIVDASQGLNKVHVSGISGNLIPTGSPAASSMCWFQVGRDYAGAFTGPAELLGVRVYYPVV